MSSYSTFRPRRKIAPYPGAFRRFANRAAMLAQANTVMPATARRGPGRPKGTTKTIPAAMAGQGIAAKVSEKTGGLRTVTSTRVKQTKAQVKQTPARLRVITADQMVRANTRTIKQVFQGMNELETGAGYFKLYNFINAGDTGVPLHAFCLTTIDRPNTDLGTHYPRFILKRDSSFYPDLDIPVVFGNQTDPEVGTATALAATGRLVMASAMIKLLFWARPEKSTTYDIAIMRFRGNAAHLQPYIGPEESQSIAGLTTDQLSERKAFWIDHLLRHMTVNPVAITKDGLSRMKKYYEVLYHKEITIDERSADEDQNDHHYEQINLPINALKNFNYSVNSRYDDNTNNDRVDANINTSVNDLYDVKQYHKASLGGNIWLIIKANNTQVSSYDGQTAGVEVTPGQLAPNVPSYDLSFECKYKTFTIQ